MFSARRFTEQLTLQQWREAISDNYLAAEAPYLAELIRWLDYDRHALDTLSHDTLSFLER